MKTCLMLLVAGGMVCGMGQTPAAQSKGVEAPWDVRKMLDGLQAQTGRLKPLLGQMQPEQWVKVGAPYAYVQQKATAANEADYFLTSAKRLAADPDKLSLAMDTYFRMEALDGELTTLIAGVRKYDNPATADVMQAVVDEGSRNVAQFRQYLTDLASQREQEYQVMDHEAQRCRAALSQQKPYGKGK